MRDVRGNCSYWNEWVEFGEKAISDGLEAAEDQGGDSGYRPQYLYDIAGKYRKLMLRRYSRGDCTKSLNKYFSGLLEIWEKSEILGGEIWSEAEQNLRHSWSLNLHFYMDCFWLTGLALALEIPDDQWQRLLVLMGNEGEDVLLDKVIASRQPGRKIGNKLRFPKAYKKLLHVIEAPPDAQPVLLREYLDGWYASLKNAGSPEVERYLRTPYWYTYGDQNFEGGAYFGRWCIEAVAVVKAFGIDDSLCLDHPNYPGDLIEDNRCLRYPDAISMPEPETRESEDEDNGFLSERKRNWLSRLLLGPDRR